MSNNVISYLEFGGSHISMIAGKIQEDSSLHILGEQQRPSDDVKSGIIKQVSGGAYKVSELIKFLQNSAKIDSITNVSVSLNAHSMRHHKHTVSIRIKESIKENFLTEAKKICKQELENESVYVYDCIPLAYYIDDRYVAEPIGERGRTLQIEFNAIIGSYKILESLERTIERTGLAVDYIHLGMEALSTVLLEDEDRETGVAIISLGATTTSLGIYFEGKLQELYVRPLGSQNITKDIQEVGISFNHAEVLKCKKGTAMRSKVEESINIRIPSLKNTNEAVTISTMFLATIIEARLTEILAPIFAQIENTRFPLDSGIVITGGGANLNNITDFIQEQTSLEVRIGDHSDWLSTSTSETFYNPSYSQAVGSIILTHDLKQKYQNTVKQEAITSKLPGKKFRKIFNRTMGNLFEYDELEKQVYEKKKNNQ